MGERKHKPTPLAPAPVASGPAGGAPSLQPRGNAAAAARLSRQGGTLAPGAKGAITAANAARFATSNGVKWADGAAARASGTERLLGDTDAGKVLGRANLGFGGLLSAASHFSGDRMVTGSVFGHAMASSAKAATDTAISAVASGGPLAALPGIVDAFVPKDSALKPVTATAAAANPFTQLKQGAGATTDMFTVGGEYLAHGPAGAYQGAQVMEDNAVDGNYGPIPQSLTAFLAMMGHDTALESKFTDAAAESGERGVFVQAGNKVGDEAWRVREAIRNAPETYDRAQQGIENGAAALIAGTSPEEVAHQRKMQALLGDRFIR